MFVIEGNISALRTAQGSVNLLQEIQNGSLFSELAAVLSGQAGMMANAASTVLYDGECVGHVALLINDRLSIGTFEWLEDLKIDDKVKLVVTEVDEGALFIHAILRMSDQILWMPLAVAKTRAGWNKLGIKDAFQATAAMLLIVAAISYAGDMALYKKYGVAIFIFTLLMTSFVNYMTTAGLMPMGKKAEDIYSALGVPRLEKFEIDKFSLTRILGISSPDALRKGNMYKFDEALKNHKYKFDHK